MVSIFISLLNKWKVLLTCLVLFVLHLVLAWSWQAFQRWILALHRVEQLWQGPAPSLSDLLAGSLTVACFLLRWFPVPLLSQGRLEQAGWSRPLAQGCGGQRRSMAVLSRRPRVSPFSATADCCPVERAVDVESGVSRWKTELHHFFALWPWQVT